MKFNFKSLLSLLFLYVVLISNIYADEIDGLNKDEYINVNFNDFVTGYRSSVDNLINSKYADRVIDITSDGNVVYLNPPEKYTSIVEFRTSERKITKANQHFLFRWFKITSSDDSLLGQNTIETILADGNFGALYTSFMVSSEGKTFYVIAQKALGNIIRQDIKNGEKIKIYFWNLGQYQNNDPVLVIVGYEKSSSFSKEVEENISLAQHFSFLRNDIENRKYDKAKGNVEMLIKKYPNNTDLKTALCLIYKETNFFERSISCYKDLMQKTPDDLNLYYGISSAYYNSSPDDLKDDAKEIINYTTKALNLIPKYKGRNQGSIDLIKYKTLFMRAMAKISIGDKSAIDDLNLINREQPIIVSNESLNIYKKRLSIK